MRNWISLHSSTDTKSQATTCPGCFVCVQRPGKDHGLGFAGAMMISFVGGDRRPPVQTARYLSPRHVYISSPAVSSSIPNHTTLATHHTKSVNIPTHLLRFMPPPHNTKTNTPKPSNLPSDVGKRHVRFRLPDTSEEAVIYLDPPSDHEEDAIMTFKRRRVYAQLESKHTPAPADVIESNQAARGTVAPGPPSLLSFSWVEPPPSPHNSISATDNKSTSGYKKHAEGVSPKVCLRLLPPLCILLVTRVGMLIMLFLLPANSRTSFPHNRTDPNSNRP